MPLPLIRLALGPTNGVAHYGVLLDGAEAVTTCATHSPDLMPVGENTAHLTCRSCARALLTLTTPPHPSGEPDERPAAGTGPTALAHRTIPGHLLARCGKPLDNRRSSARRSCASCAGAVEALNTLHRRAGALLLPPVEPCHLDTGALWAPKGRSDQATGHRWNAATGSGYCGRPLAGPASGAPGECAPCRIAWEQAETYRQTIILPRRRTRAASWPYRTLDAFGARADSLEPGDAYTLSGCSERHFVVEATSRRSDSHAVLLVYVDGEDRIAECRIRRDRFVAVERPVLAA